MTDWTRIQSQTIDWLRFPMAIAVVMIHHGVILNPTATGPLRSICILFEEGICRLAVPFFFFVSGYLFYNKLGVWNWDIWKMKIKRRVRTLFLPYILWNVIAFLALWAYINTHGNPTGFCQHFINHGGFRIFWGVDGGLPLGVRDVPIDSPLWFIRDLMYYIIASPLLFLFIQWTKLFGLLAVCIVFCFIPGFVPEGFVFFFTGAWMQINQKNVVDLSSPRRKILYLLFGLLLAATFALHDVEYWGRVCKSLFIFVGVGASFCCIAQLIKREKIHVHPFMSRSGFFIYTSFEILILHEFAEPIVRAVLPSSGLFWPCLEFFLTPALAVGVCLGLLFLMEHLLPRTTSLLTGNRKMMLLYS